MICRRLLGSLLTVGAIVAGFLLVGAEAEAQQRNLVHYTVTEGLPASRCLALLQDSRGYMWFGTPAGVARYDGATFEVFTAPDGLSGNTIVSIAEDEAGRLYFATAESTPSVWNGEGFRALGGEQIPAGGVADLGIDADAIWLATDAGLTRLDGSEMLRYTVGDGLPSARVHTVFRSNDGVLWAGTASGLARLAGGRFQPVPVADASGDVEVAVRSLAQGPDGTVWVGTDAGLFRLQGTRIEPVDDAVFATPDVASVQAAAVDHEGGLWLATQAGVVHYDGERFRRIRTSEGLLDDVVNDVLVDREGTVWFATDAGVSKLVPGAFATYTVANGLPDDFVRDLAEGPERQIWIATRSGVARVDAQAELSDPADLPADLRQLQAVAALPDGSLLLGSRYGLDWRGADAPRTYRRADGLPSDNVTSLLIEPGEGVWVGTDQGLVRWRDGAIDVGDAEALAGQHVVDLELDAESRLWVATRHTGVLRREPDGFTRVGVDEGLSGAAVWSLAADPNGGMWAGTNGLGAFLLGRDGPAIHLTQRHGLATNFVGQVLVGEGGHVWFYTNRGLDRWDPESGFTHYDTRDGLVSLEGSADAALRDSRGRLWFGTGRGLSRFTGDELFRARRPPVPPIVRIQGLSAAGEQLELEGDLRLSSEQDSVTISYVALSYRDEESTRYRYRLLGLEDRWSILTSDRRISYASLPPGEYTFEVEAISGDGVWSAEPASYRFQVAPALHQRAWFRVAVALLVVSAAVFAYLRRIGHVERERKRLAAMVEKRTRELVEKNKQLERMATTDELTGLRNRRYFLEALEMELRKLARAPKDEALSLLIIDLDDFKALNDRYGHAVGDDVLRQVAKRLEEGVRVTDIVARYGGEEFAILLPNTTPDGATYLAEKLREEIESTSLVVDGQTTWLTASFGVATMSPPERYTPELAEELLRRADEAMYEAKAAGKNLVISA